MHRKLLLSCIAFILAAAVGVAVLMITGLLDRAPAQPPVRIEASGDRTFTLFLLGGSTTQGHPYQDRLDVGRLVSAMFDDRVADMPITVRNLAQGSRNSALVIDDARRIAARKPDPTRTLVFIYCGNNEFLHLDASPQRTAGERRLFDQPIVSDAQRDAILRDYRDNLSRIITVLQAADLPVVLSTVAVNQRDFPPLRSVLRDDSNEPRVRDLLTAADRAMRGGDVQTAQAGYEQLLAIEPTFAHAAYMAATCAASLGDDAATRALFQTAVDCDANPYRATSAHNRIIRELAEAHAVPLVDAAALLATASPHGVVGYERMWDNCHPTLDGYLLLAEALAQRVRDVHPAGPPPRTLTVEQVKQRFDIDDRYESDVLGSRGEYLAAVAMLTWNRAPHLRQAGRYLDTALTLWPENPRALISRAILAAVQRQTNQFLQYWRRAYAADAQATLDRIASENIVLLMRMQGVDNLHDLLTKGAKP